MSAFEINSHYQLSLRCFNFFNKLCQNESNARSITNIIWGFYNLPKRYYHNLNHIEQCLKELDLFCEIRGYEGIAKDYLETAIWFHDIVYSPYGSINEKNSAEIAKIILSSIGCSARLFTDPVIKIIKATDLTLNPFELTGYNTIIRDIDISNLGYDWEVFKQNSRNISYEYPGTDIGEFKKRRAEFLKNTFLYSRKQIYYTDYFRNKYEQKARENIERLINE